MKVEVGFGRRDKLSDNKINAILVRIEGTVQRVGFRRFVERVARRFKIVGYAENMKDGTVRILAQGNPSGLDEFLSEIKNAPRPIIVDNMVPKKVKIVPSLRHFQIKAGSIAMELHEGFGTWETQFESYREEFRGFSQSPMKISKIHSWVFPLASDNLAPKIKNSFKKKVSLKVLQGEESLTLQRSSCLGEQ